MKAISGACRGCMLHVASHERRTEPELVKMFIYCTNLEITKVEKLPQHFCAECSEAIDSCFRFISKARKVDSTMRNYLSVINNRSADESSSEYPNICTKKEEPDENEYNDQLKIENDSGDEKTNGVVEVSLEPDFYEDAPDHDDFTVKDEEESHVKTEKKKQTKGCKTKADTKRVKQPAAECHLCNRVFSSKVWYEKHLNSAHKDRTVRLKNYICTICSKGFSRSDILTQHMVTHSDDRPFLCNLCPNKYKMRKQLNRHLRMHRDQALYKCDICGSSFKWKAVLMNHMRVHEDKKQHLCDLCGAGFTQLGNLVQHKRTHSGEKPFACPHCPFRCSMSSSLRRHQRIHDGTKPHTCHTCGKPFRDYSSLLRHIRTHTGELPYRCMFCSQAFIDSGKRKRHIVRHHPVAVGAFPSAAAARPRDLAAAGAGAERARALKVEKPA